MNEAPAIDIIAPDPTYTRRGTQVRDPLASARVNRTRGRWCGGLVLLGLLAGWIALQAFLPLGTAVQIGADEGFELAKATLQLNGQSLYTEAWNDQPPLHTFVVVQVLKHLSPGVLGARLVTVVAAAVLLAGVFSLTYRVCGLGVAGLTAVLLTIPGALGLVMCLKQCRQAVWHVLPVAWLALMLVSLPRIGPGGRTTTSTSRFHGVGAR